MTDWDDRETPGAECEDIPFDEAVRLFFPTSDGGQLRRTAPWPKPDSHADARRLCGHCPLIGRCLDLALHRDGWTFRGGMSPEERAAFGGFRDRDTRRRGVYLTPHQVAARLVDAGVDVVVVAAVIRDWQQRVSASDDLSTETGAVVDSEGAVESAEDIERLAAEQAAAAERRAAAQRAARRARARARRVEQATDAADGTVTRRPEAS